MIEVKKIPIKGRGIIATQDIPKGTLLERAPVASFPMKKSPTNHETEVFQYYFVQPIENETNKKNTGYIVFGLASLCNHEDKPNARVDWIEDEIGLWSNLIAETDIKAGEEVTLFHTNIDEYDTEKFV